MTPAAISSRRTKLRASERMNARPSPTGLSSRRGPDVATSAGPGCAGVFGGPLTAFLQELHEHERAELSERTVVRRGCFFECTLERRLHAKADEVVLGHDQ